MKIASVTANIAEPLRSDASDASVTHTCVTSKLAKVQSLFTEVTHGMRFRNHPLCACACTCACACVCELVLFYPSLRHYGKKTSDFIALEVTGNPSPTRHPRHLSGHVRPLLFF